ncbi:methyltransferase type 11 [Moniliophthora roreri]|uniref:Methyltransferase domain-containing protein n=1 Tax=Moniliophthora roreri TaxID=221103 RepID=A0A0W0GBB9_MONRR|nr:methyltransferase type 11 [Moniliophthora roreri]
MSESTGDEERERLENQFWYYRNLHGRGSVFDPSVTIPADGSVLDSGAGSGAWLFQLSKELPSTVSFYGIDKSPAHICSDSVPNNITFLSASVTALPEEWSSKFDLVSQSFLIGYLSRSQAWPLAIKELHRVLKPGGHIQLLEPASLFRYRNMLRDNPAPPESAARKIRDLMHAIQKKYDLLDNCAVQIPEMLASAGFRDIACSMKEAPRVGADSGSGDYGSEQLMRAVRRTKNVIMKNDGFGIVRDAAEFDALVVRYRDECEEKGYPAVQACLVCAQK